MRGLPHSRYDFFVRIGTWMLKCEGHGGVVVKETLMSSPCHEVVRASLVVTLVKIPIIIDV